ncbi:aldo/keto reductase [Furfurilactobacillus entadae]|uniref:aldo/keto reductase n=1 Tax=Furfurilactobacillus entadae TaxID=2922307 RepID=UPI0035EDAC0D
MEYINLGNSDLHASNIGLGIMRMNLLSVAEATTVLETAVDLGINFFDGADIYGEGKSDTIFGQALAASGLNRSDIYVQGKVGIVLNKDRSHDGLVFGARYDFSEDHLVTAAHDELNRMGLDYFDSLLLHRPDPLMEPDQVARALTTLQTDGTARHFGVSNQNPYQIELLQHSLHQRLLINQLQFSIMHTGMIDAEMHVNMADDRSIDHDNGILAYTRLHNMTIQAWSPYQYGMFEGVFIDNPKFPELNQELQRVADRYAVTKTTIATAWILRHPAKIQTIVGSMNPARLKEIALANQVHLTAQEWYDIYLSAGNDLP